MAKACSTRVSALILAAALLAAVGSSPAEAKDGVHAELRTPLPADAAPGRSLTVSWRLVHGEDGTTFHASGLYVELRSPSGGDPVTATGVESGGWYVAHGRVPEGGLAGVRFGLEGWRSFAGGKTERADVFFPLEGRLFAVRPSPGDGGRPVLLWLAGVLVLLVGGSALLARRALRRRHLALATSSHQA